MKYRLRAFALGSAVVLGAATGHAQSTEPAPPTAGRAPETVVAAKAATEPKSDSSFIDTAREWAKNTRIVERIEGDVDGWYPRLSGMTRGGGFTIGPGYRTHVLGNRVFLDVSAAMTPRLYRAVDVHARWLQAWSERAELWTDYRYQFYPQEDFFGVGPTTTPDMRTSYALRGSDFVLRGQVKPVAWLRLNAKLGYSTPRIGAGRDREFPSIEQLFADTSAPGLASQPDFIHSELAATIDFRDVPGNPRAGTLYRVAYSFWNDRTLDTYNFQRFESLATQYVPLTASRTHVVSGRVGVTFVNNAPGDRVPFYALPYVGGIDTVRSFREFRFKDENALWFGAEYQWTPIKWASGVLFTDFGQVAHNWQDISADLKSGYGFGFRAHTSKQTFAQLDFGFGGGEGWRAFLRLGL